MGLGTCRFSSEFGTYGLIDYEEISELTLSVENKPSQRFTIIVCRKGRLPEL